MDVPLDTSGSRSSICTRNLAGLRLVYSCQISVHLQHELGNNPIPPGSDKKDVYKVLALFVACMFPITSTTGTRMLIWSFTEIDISIVVDAQVVPLPVACFYGRRFFRNVNRRRPCSSSNQGQPVACWIKAPKVASPAMKMRTTINPPICLNALMLSSCPAGNKKGEKPIKRKPPDDMSG